MPIADADRELREQGHGGFVTAGSRAQGLRLRDGLAGSRDAQRTWLALDGILQCATC